MAKTSRAKDDGAQLDYDEQPQKRVRRRTAAAAEPAHDDGTDEEFQPARPGKAAKGENKRKLHSPAWNTSRYRGVTKHRRSGRWEAHIWIGKGVNKQIYLGGYEKEEHAAEAYDMAALKTKGFETPTNFSKDRYRELEGCLENATLEELVTAVRRQSQGFSRGTSAYRGVSPHPSGRFEARIGIAGNKHVYLGLYNKEAEAAKAYDQAVVRIKGNQASTNFTLSDYQRELTEHELKQVELQNPAAFRVMEMGEKARQQTKARLPGSGDITITDAKALSSCTDQDFQKWVRSGYPEQHFNILWEALKQVHGDTTTYDNTLPGCEHPSAASLQMPPPGAHGGAHMLGQGDPNAVFMGMCLNSLGLPNSGLGFPAGMGNLTSSGLDALAWQSLGQVAGSLQGGVTMPQLSGLSMPLHMGNIAALLGTASGNGDGAGEDDAGESPPDAGSPQDEEAVLEN